MEIAYAGVLLKQIGVGALCCLIWIMMDIKISMFAIYLS
jgi:hypothetical protein